jgi:hypothetical protein
VVSESWRLGARSLSCRVISDPQQTVSAGQKKKLFVIHAVHGFPKILKSKCPELLGFCCDSRYLGQATGACFFLRWPTSRRNIRIIFIRRPEPRGVMFGNPRWLPICVAHQGPTLLRICPLDYAMLCHVMGCGELYD